jgi:hypothetical protein
MSFAEDRNKMEFYVTENNVLPKVDIYLYNNAGGHSIALFQKENFHNCRFYDEVENVNVIYSLYGSSLKIIADYTYITEK